MKRYFRYIKELFRYNYINPGAKLGKNVRIDHFVVIDDNVEIGDNTWIGNWVHIRPGSRIGHNSEIRDWCYISTDVQIGNHTKVCQKANIGGYIKIGNGCFLAPGLSTSNTKNIKHNRKIKDYVIDIPIIEDNVRIGTNVTILPGVVLGKDSYIGGGAVVTKSTDPYGVYIGNPAKKIKEVLPEERV